MVNILGIVIGTLVVTILGGGIGYWAWLRTRPKKQTWNAKVYQLGEGVRPPKVDQKTGKVLSNVQLQDLIPYSKDIIEKVDKEPGITIFRLQKMNKVSPPIESSMTEYWGEGDNEVSCLLAGDEIFLLKKGYDRTTGESVVQPISQSKMNLIKGEMSIRKDRLTKTKDILSAISPWIVAGICMIGLVMISYIMISGFIEVSENMESASQNLENNVIKPNNNNNNLGLQEKNKPKEPKEETKQKDIPMVEG